MKENDFKPQFLEILIDTWTSEFTSRINGLQDIAYSTTGWDSTIERVLLGLRGSYFDDVSYGHSGWPGDIRYEVLVPNAVQGTNEWTCSTGTDHYALVDEIPPSDTDYLSTDTDDLDDIFSNETVKH